MSITARNRQQGELLAGVSVRELSVQPHAQGGRSRAKGGADRRQLPRASMDLSMAVIGAGGSPVTARMLDLSRTGLKLAFDKSAAEGLFQDGTIRPGEVIQSQFRLPGTAVIKVKCRIAWSARTDADQYHVGCQFVKFHEQGYELVEKYLLDCLAYPAA